MSRWTLRDLQAEYGEWRARNFPESTSMVDHACAIAEEVGEVAREGVPDDLTDWLMPVKMASELADVTITVVGACTVLGEDAQSLLEDALYGHVTDDVLARSMTVAVGKFARAALKTAHGIRGTREQHAADARAALVALLRQVHGFYQAAGESMLHHAEENWKRVSARDWRRNSVDGTVPA